MGGMGMNNGMMGMGNMGMGMGNMGMSMMGFKWNWIKTFYS